MVYAWPIVRPRILTAKVCQNNLLMTLCCGYTRKRRRTKMRFRLVGNPRRAAPCFTQQELAGINGLATDRINGWPHYNQACTGNNSREVWGISDTTTDNSIGIEQSHGANTVLPGSQYSFYRCAYVDKSIEKGVLPFKVIRNIVRSFNLTKEQADGCVQMIRTQCDSQDRTYGP